MRLFYTVMRTPVFLTAVAALAFTAATAQESPLHAPSAEAFTKPDSPQAHDNPKGGITFESFEGEFPPPCWTMIDADGDGFGFFHYNVPNSAWDGEYSAASASWLSGVGALTPDNYLITPAMVVDPGMSLMYRVAAQDPDIAADQYGIYVSTTGNEDPSDFTDELFVETLPPGPDWHERVIDMSAYEGQEIHIAFRHFGSTDQFYIKFDAVSLPGIPLSCLECTYPTVTPGQITCGDASWVLYVNIEDVPEGKTYSLTNSLNSNTVEVTASSAYIVGPFDEEGEVILTLTDLDEPTCSQEVAVVNGDCTVPCEVSFGNPISEFNEVEGGIPVPEPGEACPTATLTNPVYGGASYLLSDLPADVYYEFSACTGEGSGDYEINYTVVNQTSGEVVASWNDGDGCSITWNTDSGGDFLVIVNYEGYCGTQLDAPNGVPSLTCAAPDGLAEVLATSGAVYPNPTDGELVLRLPLEGEVTISVYDASGRLVLTKRTAIHNGETRLDFTSLEDGLYVLKTESPQGNAAIRFVKQ